MSLLVIKSILRHRLCSGLNRYAVISERHIRGRIRSDPNQIRPEINEELDDYEITDFKGSRTDQTDRRQPYDRQEIYDSRRNTQSFDKFDRAIHGFDDRHDYNNKNNYFNKRENFNTNNRRERNFDNNYKSNDNRYDKRYDNRNNNNYNNNYNNRYNNNYNRLKAEGNYRQNNYQNFNQNQYSENRWQRTGKYDNSDQNNDRNKRYYERKESNEYRNYNNRNQINDFNAEDNAIFNTSKQFDFDGQRPRFSSLREFQTNANKKLQRNQHKFDSNSVESLDTKAFEVEKEFETSEDNSKRNQEKIPLPFNVTAENRFEVLNQIVTPLHLKPYNLQLSIKYKKQMEILKKLGKKFKLINSPVICDPQGLPCPLELVKPSPIIDRYRNKDEFSIWPGVDGFNKTVGFFIGQPSLHENVICVEPDQIIVSRESHLSLAKKFQSYLKDVSTYDSCQNYGDGGHWRRFHIRSNNSGQHMITAIMHPQELSQQELDEEMQRYREYFEGDDRISSMYFQASRHTRLSNEKEPFVHLMGDKTILETLFDKKFEISVDSFFQINSSAAEVLYRNVISELNVTKNTTVLDICCGIGTLATIMAPNVCRVIGIDSSASAINDAKRNAVLNDIKNVSFIAGKVEEKLPQMMDELYSQDIVVVANPTRAGLHASVINALREINYIRKFVYVSCKPEGTAFKNFLHLCVPSNRDNRHMGQPFVPTNAIPVDLFPHTDHCELIVTFERF